MNELTTADKVAMYLGGGLVLFGTFGIGFLEMLAGTEHPVSGDGQIEHDALIDLKIRSYIILAGLLIWGLYAVYRIAAGPPAGRSARA
jgi:hypothetical protein